MKFWWTIDKQKQRIIDKIIKRANLCMYSRDTGEKYGTDLNVEKHIKYDQCSGKKIDTGLRNWVMVSICETKTSRSHWDKKANIKRNGDIMGRHIDKTEDGRFYIIY